MRKESSNQFSDGLINDLNPINTPNNVLTDNLNGTIITYNGNEYSLQNDMGNYKLQNCKLKPNYVPVGIKEYGDILYIVSYNPLDEHVEIGSYPAPERILGDEGSENDGSQEIFSLFEKTKCLLNKSNVFYYKYSDLIKQSSLSTFYNGDNGNLFLNPGDQFQIKDIKNLQLTTVEYIKHFVVDENRRLYDVQWVIDKQDELYGDSTDYRYVGWDVPGWLAIKVELANFEEFNVNIRQVKIPIMIDNNFSTDIDLNFQLKIRDTYFQENGNSDLQNKGYIYLSIKSDKEQDLIYNTTYPHADLIWEDLTFYKIPLNDNNSNFGYLNWYPDANIYHLDIPSIKTIPTLSKSDIITITAIPVVETNDNKHVIYDNFIFQQDVALNNAGSIEDLNLGNNIFRFWVDKDEKENPEYFSIEYDVEGPFTQSSSVNLYYAIWDIQNFESETRVTPYKPVEGFNGIGQNLMQIPFDSDILEYKYVNDNDDEIEIKTATNWYTLWEKDKRLGTTKENVPENININKSIETSIKFEPESYYVIQYVFAENISDINLSGIDDLSKSKSFWKILLTTEILNTFNESNNQIITKDELIDYYLKYIEFNTKLNVTSTSKIEASLKDNSFVSAFMKYYKDKETPNLVDFLSDNIKFILYDGKEIIYNPSITTNSPKGVLWNDLTSTIKTEINSISKDDNDFANKSKMFIGNQYTLRSVKTNTFQNGYYNLDKSNIMWISSSENSKDVFDYILPQDYESVKILGDVNPIDVDRASSQINIGDCDNRVWSEVVRQYAGPCWYTNKARSKIINNYFGYYRVCLKRESGRGTFKFSTKNGWVHDDNQTDWKSALFLVIKMKSPQSFYVDEDLSTCNLNSLKVPGRGYMYDNCWLFPIQRLSYIPDDNVTRSTIKTFNNKLNGSFIIRNDIIRSNKDFCYMDHYATEFNDTIETKIKNTLFIDSYLIKNNISEDLFNKINNTIFSSSFKSNFIEKSDTQTMKFMIENKFINSDIQEFRNALDEEMEKTENKALILKLNEIAKVEGRSGFYLGTENDSIYNNIGKTIIYQIDSTKNYSSEDKNAFEIIMNNVDEAWDENKLIVGLATSGHTKDLVTIGYYGGEVW